MTEPCRAPAVDLPELVEGETLDTMFQGAIRLIQHRDGYRFSLDAVLLAHFAQGWRGPALDLGTGCGVIPLLLDRIGRADRIVGVEIQRSLWELACRNVALNGATDRVEIYHQDLRRIQEAFTVGSFSMVVSNPPYRPLATGRLNPTSEKAIARHEVSCTIRQVVQAARYLLQTGGRFATIYPAERLADLFGELRHTGLEVKQLRLVYPQPGSPARLALVEAMQGGRATMTCLPPLIVHDGNGEYTPELQAMLGAPDEP